MTDSPGDSRIGQFDRQPATARSGKVCKTLPQLLDRLSQSRILAERGVRSYHTAFQARSAGDFPDGATRIDRHDAVEDSDVVFDVLGDDMVIGLGCEV